MPDVAWSQSATTGTAWASTRLPLINERFNKKGPKNTRCVLADTTSIWNVLLQVAILCFARPALAKPVRLKLTLDPKLGSEVICLVLILNGKHDAKYSYNWWAWIYWM